MDTFLSATKTTALRRNLLRKMLATGVFKFGEFTLKSGQKSPIYIDFRECFSNPELLVRQLFDDLPKNININMVQKLLSEALAELITLIGTTYSGIVGVPYGALPHASLVAGCHLNKPLLIVRKEAKAHGTKKLVEGTYKEGDSVIIIEDVVTTGGSVIDVVNTLRNEGLTVKDVFCILDRQQGGFSKLKDVGIEPHSLFDMETILTFLVGTKTLNTEGWLDVVRALNLNIGEKPFAVDVSLDEEDLDRLPISQCRSTLRDRSSVTESPFNRKVFNLMHKKRTNLCLALDYNNTDEILKMAKLAAPYVLAVKLHVDAINDFSKEFTTQLVKLANDEDFIIFEDRKFADTANTTVAQLTEGTFRIAEWADVVTVHAIQGSESICSSFRQVILDPKYRLSGILLIAQLSTKGSLTALPGYTNSAAEIAANNRDIVSGFICQARISEFSDLLSWTPGVNMGATTDGAGQQWRGPLEAIEKQQNDIVIVGRGITGPKVNATLALKAFRRDAWNALMKDEEDADLEGY